MVVTAERDRFEGDVDLRGLRRLSFHRDKSWSRRHTGWRVGHVLFIQGPLHAV